MRFIVNRQLLYGNCAAISYETISPIDSSSRHALNTSGHPRLFVVPIDFQPNSRLVVSFASFRPFQSEAARNENIIELLSWPFPRDCTLLRAPRGWTRDFSEERFIVWGERGNLIRRNISNWFVGEVYISIHIGHYTNPEHCIFFLIQSINVYFLKCSIYFLKIYLIVYIFRYSIKKSAETVSKTRVWQFSSPIRFSVSSIQATSRGSTKGISTSWI